LMTEDGQMKLNSAASSDLIDDGQVRLVRRRRPGDTQREQKEFTRRKLLDAAQIVFEQCPYYATAVEMLAEQAGVSRTTFYRHFDGKLAVALALFEDLKPLLIEQWKAIFAAPSPQFAEVRSWLDGLIAVSASNRVLVSVFGQIEAIEQEIAGHKYGYYDQIFELLGVVDDKIDAAMRDRLKAKFLLLMIQIDQFLYMVCSRRTAFDADVLEDAMAEIIHEFFLGIQNCRLAR
jgi:AcrR family transcriptional regulator